MNYTIEIIQLATIEIQLQKYISQIVYKVVFHNGDTFVEKTNWINFLEDKTPYISSDFIPYNEIKKGDIVSWVEKLHSYEISKSIQQMIMERQERLKTTEQFSSDFPWQF
jgi:hypothetical protein